MIRLIHILPILLTVSLLWSAEKQESKPLPKITYEALIKAQEEMGQNQLTKASATLDTLKKRLEEGEPHEKAYILNSYGYLHLQKEEYPQAMGYFKQALSLQALPLSTQLSTLYNLAQLAMMQEQYREAVTLLMRWLGESKEEKPEAYAFLAMAYISLNEHAQALPHAEKAHALKPSVQYLEMLFAINYHLKNLQYAAANVRDLIAMKPETERYYLQLSGILSERGQARASLAPLEMAYRLGILKESGIIRLSQLQYEQKAPYRGAVTLKESMQKGLVTDSSKHYRLLEAFYREAKETDLAIKTSQEAIGKFDDPEWRLNLVQLLYEKERYQEAIHEGSQIPVNSMEAKTAGSLQLLLGRSHYELKRYAEALEFFKTAKRYANARKTAERWINHLKNLAGNT